MDASALTLIVGRYIISFFLLVWASELQAQPQPQGAVPGQVFAEGQHRESLAGEAAAQALKRAAQAEAESYNMQLGPVGFQTRAKLNLGFTDNVFYSQENRKSDFVINPEVGLGAFMQVSELNTLKLSLGLGYEYYVRNSSLNSSAPLVNPDSELAFNLFVGDFRFRFHDKFSYQETLFYNISANRQDLLFNFNDVGRFSRWDNLAGFNVDWDLNKYIFTLSYDHENFTSTKAEFDYLTRASELVSLSGGFRIGDKASVGLESQAGWHNYDQETVMNDHWQLRAGPFVQFKNQENLKVRVGGGYDTAEYKADAQGSDFHSYYAYGSLEQELRLFKHSLSVGHEHLLGDNANNLVTTYVRYSIMSPIFEHFDVGANAAVHFAKEFGGAFQEDFTYYLAGFKVGYQIHKYWRTEVRYEFMMKDSELPLRDFYRDRVSLAVEFIF